MLQLRNRTPFAAGFFLAADPDGRESVYTIVKGTFSLNPKVSPAEKQVPVTYREEYLGEPGQSSIRGPSDVSLMKPGTDVLLQGSAYAPGGRQAQRTAVSLSVGPIRKTVGVIGDRVWESGLLGAKSSPPLPFEKMPLVWERAFGGVDRVDRGTIDADERNPVGTGFRARGS